VKGKAGKMMEFLPLRSLQRGLPEVWRALQRENGRLVLTNKGQPAYLLVDLDGQNVISLINMLDEYRNSQPKIDGIVKTEAIVKHSQTLDIVQDFLANASAADDGALTDSEWEELENIRSKTNLTREIGLEV
jgi:hypothetical protein